MSVKLDDLEDMFEYKVGLWYSPFVKIYSIGGKNRIAEISNYPRVYKDITPHVYIKDIPFTVSKSDLNHWIEEEEVYRDSREGIFRLDEEAIHWKGDPLPGAFPLWLESEELPFEPNPDKHTFSLDKVPGPIVDLAEVSLKAGAVFVKLSEVALAAVREHLLTGKIAQNRKSTDGDKQIIRIRYRRVF